MVDPYLAEFSATVTEAKGDWVALDRTAFYPGGGGQDPDRGELGGGRVIDVKQEGGKVLHKVTGAALSVGQHVQAKIDWSRRYDLMQGHTGEHLLFSRLKLLSPDLELVKIAITPERKSFVLKGPLDWDAVANAQEMARQAIEASLPITESVVRKGDPILERTRVKLDRIPGDEVRVVSIGDIDRAACAGVHVRNTGELGLLLITKFTSARPAADYEVEFEVGAKARARALELSAAALQAAGSVGSRPQDLLSAVANLKAAKERAEASLRSYSAQALRGLIPSEVGGVKLYSGIFEGVDKKVLMDAANEFTAEEAVCVLGSAGERFLLVVACHPSVGIDCVAALNEALATVGGKGGGKPNFATGGSPSPEKAEEAMVGAIVAVRKALEARL